MSPDGVRERQGLASKSRSKKRAIAEDEGPTKRKKQKKRRARTEQDESLLDMEVGVNRGIALMDPQLMADHLAQKTSRFGSDLSPVELSDLYISPHCIEDTTSWQQVRTLANLPTFLEHFSKGAEKLGQAPKQKGAPHTLIVTGAGLRAAEIVRAVRKYQTKDCVVAKLFAKHIKLEEAAKFLQDHRTGLGVGTPARLKDLVENGSLSLDNVERLVVDASHIDQKKRGVLDMKELMMPLTRWLNRKEFKERYASIDKPLQLLFY